MGFRSSHRSERAVAKTTTVNRSESAEYVQKAREFLAETEAAVAAGRTNAALLCAIHAAISGADALTVALSGLRSTDPNHMAVGDLLRSAGRGSEEFETRARQLVGILQLKNLIEYEARTARPSEAEDALKRARRFVEWALDNVSEAGATG
jgi:hypothetical protein